MLRRRSGRVGRRRAWPGGRRARQRLGVRAWLLLAVGMLIAAGVLAGLAERWGR